MLSTGPTCRDSYQFIPPENQLVTTIFKKRDRFFDRFTTHVPEITLYLMEEISHVFGMLFAAVMSGPTALANPTKQFIEQKASVVTNTKALEAPFLKMLDENHGIIDKISHAYCDTPDGREDLYQEIVYQLWRSYPSFQGESKISTWMYAVALRA